MTFLDTQLSGYLNGLKTPKPGQAGSVVPSVKIINGDHVVFGPAYSLRWHATEGPCIVMHGTMQGTTLNGTNLLTFDEVEAVARAIDYLADLQGKYATVKLEPEWQQLYQMQARTFYVVDAHGVETPVPMDTIPCNACGLRLPLNQIQVDHSHPKAGGRTAAVCKMLRTLDMTKAGPVGAKSTNMRNVWLAGGRFAVAGPYLGAIRQPKGQAITARPAARLMNAAARNRYSLDHQGNAFYSLVVAAGLKDLLEKKALNSMVNLKPLCGTCNGLKSNAAKYL